MSKRLIALGLLALLARSHGVVSKARSKISASPDRT